MSLIVTSVDYLVTIYKIHILYIKVFYIPYSWIKSWFQGDNKSIYIHKDVKYMVGRTLVYSLDFGKDVISGNSITFGWIFEQKENE